MSVPSRKAFALGVLVLAVSAAQAGDNALAGIQLDWDNDLWAKGRTDRWYTNGIRASWAYKEGPDNAISQALSDASRSLLWNDTKPILSYAIGQSLYTPANIHLSTPQPQDRPWAAFLYGSVTAHAFEKDTGGRSNEFRVTELKLGLTGPKALGDEVQSSVHKAIGSRMPMGWDRQLGTRLGVELTHARVYRLHDLPAHEYLGAQLGWGTTVGTLRSHANLNAALVIGDLQGSNAPLLIGNEGDYVVADFSNYRQFDRPFAFVGASITGVGNNYFLDGDPPHGRSQIDRKPGYAMWQWGISLPLTRWWGSGWPRLVFAQTSRTAEFSSPTLRAKESIQRWGTLTLQWDFDH